MPEAPADDRPPPSSPEPPRQPAGEVSGHVASEHRREALAALAVMGAVLLAVVATRLWGHLAPRPTVEQCEALVDRYVEHASRQFDPAVDEQDIELAITASRDRPGSREADVKACARRLSASQVACALACHNVDEMERCLQ